MSLDTISKLDLKELLSKNWLTHDAMWFAISVQTIGIEQTNTINRKAARSMALIEARRLSKVLNITKLQSVNELIDFLHKAFDLIVGDYMQGDFYLAGENSIIFETKKCFAFEGVSKIGVISSYECGIFERIEGWFDYFKITYSKEPNDLSCLMHSKDKCIKKYTFTFSKLN